MWRIRLGLTGQIVLIAVVFITLLVMAGNAFSDNKDTPHKTVIPLTAQAAVIAKAEQERRTVVLRLISIQGYVLVASAIQVIK